MNKAIPAPSGQDWRTSPVYTVEQAARLAGVSGSTVKRWLFGQQMAKSRIRPVFGVKERAEGVDAEISFLQLIEILVANRFRRRGVTLERLRRAHDYARGQWNAEYPFASLRLKTDGAHVLHEFESEEPGASLVALDQGGQLTLPTIVAATIETFEFEQELVARWYPAGRQAPIVIDPRFGAGMPTIAGRRLRIATIRDRWRAGESIRFIADDFELDPGEVESALRYADTFAA